MHSRLAASGAPRDRRIVGGLDSAIVAAGLARSGADHIIGWYHYVGADPTGDERAYARAVAAKLGLALSETSVKPEPLTRDLIDAIPLRWRPGLGSTSLFHDRHLAGRGVELNADMLLTGHGGDAVFFQPPTPWIACELFAERRSWREAVGRLCDLARWTGHPVWAVLSSAWRARHGAVRIDPPAVPFVRGGLPEVWSSSWLETSELLPPAKQLQLWALANARSALGVSYCSEHLEVRHPLLSQPVVEHVLGLSALTLTEGRRDRALARRAYTGILPDVLIARRGKGSLNRHFGQVLAASVAALRPYLLDGVLAERGVIVPERLAPLLSAETLMIHDHYAALLTMLLLERWARGWHGLKGNQRR